MTTDNPFDELWDSTGRVVVVNEGVHSDIVGDFTDMNGEVILKASLASVKLTLFDRNTRAVINSRNLQNVLDANGGTVDADGVITMRLIDIDNVILDVEGELEAGDIEEHIARFTWGWNDGVLDRESEKNWLVRVRKKDVPVA